MLAPPLLWYVIASPLAIAVLPLWSTNGRVISLLSPPTALLGSNWSLCGRAVALLSRADSLVSVTSAPLELWGTSTFASSAIDAAWVTVTTLIATEPWNWAPLGSPRPDVADVVKESFLPIGS